MDEAFHLAAVIRVLDDHGVVLPGVHVADAEHVQAHVHLLRGLLDPDHLDATQLRQRHGQAAETGFNGGARARAQTCPALQRGRGDLADIQLVQQGFRPHRHLRLHLAQFGFGHRVLLTQVDPLGNRLLAKFQHTSRGARWLPEYAGRRRRLEGDAVHDLFDALTQYQVPTQDCKVRDDGHRGGFDQPFSVWDQDLESGIHARLRPFGFAVMYRWDKGANSVVGQAGDRRIKRQ